jgi:DNA-nicking Smr family endonuclease
MNTDFESIFKNWEKSNKIIDKDSLLSYNSPVKSGREEKNFTLDLHGMTKNEALISLEKKIRELRTGYPVTLIVIHGVGRHSKGPRVLKEAVTEWLKQHPEWIKTFRPAGIGEGSGGATVCIIRSE